ncbi:thymosin beta-like [Diaphorina citri]|uniref:Thymosin beta-like n=1 Tax=Diaphorina citri TaxID=121845 RepID=A0A1S3DTB0_DIACI|nr:thymosin beta-like [Diaphorina citri]
MAAPALKDLPKVAEDLKSQLETFDSSKKLNNTETLEKNVLPTKEDVLQERQHNDLIHSVENFNADKLKRINTCEKIILPNAQGLY